jgi:hypothetical protein
LRAFMPRLLNFFTDRALRGKGGTSPTTGCVRILSIRVTLVGRDGESVSGGFTSFVFITF